VTKKSEIADNISSNRNSFKIIAILLPFFLFVLVEVTLRIFSLGTNLNLIVNRPSDKYEDYFIVNPLVGEKYFSRFEATSGTNDLFLKHKPANGFRIFVMGSSTIYGYPYDRNLMATRILKRRLQDTFPDKTIEVVNKAITAINSITLKDYIGEIVNYEPDAILFYAGHNEFYGAYGVGANETMHKNPLFRTVHFKLMNLRIFQLLRNAVTGISAKMASKAKTILNDLIATAPQHREISRLKAYLQ